MWVMQWEVQLRTRLASTARASTARVSTAIVSTGISYLEQPHGGGQLGTQAGNAAQDQDADLDGTKKAVESVALEAARSSTRGSGWVPSGPASS